MKGMRLFLSALIITVFLSLFLPISVSAETTTLKLRILPQDCAFDVVDVGTQELLFLTPELCGVPPSPEPSSPNQPSTVVVDKPLELTVDQVEDGLDGPTQMIRWSIDEGTATDHFEKETSEELLQWTTILVGVSVLLWLILKKTRQGVFFKWSG